ncbi:glycoside hydrolase family 35 protein [Amanita thiersii Skay4041]|uniref:Beta-galactosidase n=1 Tax=Amanita thiersii Skay4041 TaxID=703135 RepID=A0A2A9NPT0_9AGAR|nr:glycoside hydrolase family 35 protein [Amanita thiersii Skay4041]
MNLKCLQLSFYFLNLLLVLFASGNQTRSVSKQDKLTRLQDIVTWDEYSLMINGTRLMLFSGEVHPYRMPVQSLHLDIFQKIKSMGFNAVSFYVFWGILEPKRGTISFEGFRDLQPFFDAAMEAGLYLIARPGPYINAETSGGGFPGWGTTTAGLWRTSNTTYIEAYQQYIKAVGSKIAQNQVTNGGPVILVQAENEYSGFQPPFGEDLEYESRLMSDLRATGINVPITTNDAWPGGHYTTVDIYGYDSYPNGFDCANPTIWKEDAVPEWLWGGHEQYNPQDLNAVYEFQGGAFDGWGGSGYAHCALLTGTAFERVFYKNQFAMSTTLLNLYMVYGGTNWGGIAHPGVYTSYDYGAAIAEDRTLREKYYELKLQAYFLAVSPAYLTSRPMNIYATQGAFTKNQALKTTQVLDVIGNKTAFYVVRQADASTDAIQSYRLNLSTSIGQLSLPLLNGSLTLHGKDSKIHVTDYPAGSTILVYSTSEILTWATVDGRDIIFIYGDQGERHETAFKINGDNPTGRVVAGTGNIKTQLVNDVLIVQYETTGQTVVEISPRVFVYILDRVNAYQTWVLHLPTTGPFSKFDNHNPVIIKGGYLLRSANTSGGNLAITGDLNSTTSFEIIAPAAVSKSISINGVKVLTKKTTHNTLVAEQSISLPTVALPHLATLKWRRASSLPEIRPTYSDIKWTSANHNTTVNPTTPPTPVVLYAGDYGYHTGNILWRAHFNATGSETGFTADIWGGSAFGYSVWLDSIFIGSWEGDAIHANYERTFAFPKKLEQESSHVLTILQDHMGYEEDWTAASDFFKIPRGIMNYSFPNSPDTTVNVWKVAGNLGGEDYVDTVRGPLNEGGLYGERQGWHLPGFDDTKWESGSPIDGMSTAGVMFYRTTFPLNIPDGVDYPMALVIANSTINPHFRAQFYVNGYQFGKYINHIGPQKSFPVPQGILNYKGINTLAVSLWAVQDTGARLDTLELLITAKLKSAMPPVVNQPLTAWSLRPNAF